MNKVVAGLMLFLFAFCKQTSFSFAADRSVELRICSQNLNRLGEKELSVFRKKSRTRKKQLEYLVERMSEARCDVVAVQEVVGSNESSAQRSLERLARALSTATQREFSVLVGESRDTSIRNGFLIANDTGTILDFKSYDREPVERLVPYGPVGNFLRAPIGLWLGIEKAGDQRKIFILNIHFKSRSGGYKDGQKLDFEGLRMESAEASRKIFLRERERYGRNALAVLVGDRNADSGTATAEILTGTRVLADWKRSREGRYPNCTLDEGLAPDCGNHPSGKKILLPLLELASRKHRYPLATYRYRGREEILDEIFIPEDVLSVVRKPNEALRVGVLGEYSLGSDHKLVWVDLDW